MHENLYASALELGGWWGECSKEHATNLGSALTAARCRDLPTPGWSHRYPETTSLRLQMLSPSLKGRALELNNVIVKIITHTDRLEVEGMSQNTEQKAKSQKT